MIMVRPQSGAINVLANRRAHRGTALSWEHQGHNTSFQCDYHRLDLRAGWRVAGGALSGRVRQGQGQPGVNRAGQLS